MAILFLIGIAVYSLGSFAYQPVGSNTVSRISYPTVTATVTATQTIVPTATDTIQPVETLTTATALGAQTYTATETATATVTSTATATTTLSSLIYAPFYMYWVMSNNTGFYRSLTPLSVTQNGDALAETTTGFDAGSLYTGSATMTINQVSTNYNDLGFYYEFQNLNLGELATGGYSITITSTTGSSYGVNFYLNPQDWTWSPTASSSIEKWTGLGSDGAYGLGPSGTSPTLTISGTTSVYMIEAVGSCSGGTTYTISELVSTCDLASTTPFALWVGVGPIGPGSVTATITQVLSSPYP